MNTIYKLIIAFYFPLFMFAMEHSPNSNNAQWDYKSFGRALEIYVTVKSHPTQAQKQIRILLKCYHQLAEQLQKRARFDIKAHTGKTICQLTCMLQKPEQSPRYQQQLALPYHGALPRFMVSPSTLLAGQQRQQAELDDMLFQIASAESEEAAKKIEQEEIDCVLAHIVQEALEFELDTEIKQKIAAYENVERECIWKDISSERESGSAIPLNSLSVNSNSSLDKQDEQLLFMQKKAFLEKCAQARMEKENASLLSDFLPLESWESFERPRELIETESRDISDKYLQDTREKEEKGKEKEPYEQVPDKSEPLPSNSVENLAVDSLIACLKELNFKSDPNDGIITIESFDRFDDNFLWKTELSRERIYTPIAFDSAAQEPETRTAYYYCYPQRLTDDPNRPVKFFIDIKHVGTEDSFTGNPFPLEKPAGILSDEPHERWRSIPVYFALDAESNIVYDTKGNPVFDIRHPGNSAVLPDIMPSVFLAALNLHQDLIYRTDIQDVILTHNENLAKGDKRLMQLTPDEQKYLHSLGHSLGNHRQKLQNICDTNGINSRILKFQYRDLEQQAMQMNIDYYFNQIAANQNLTSAEQQGLLAHIGQWAYELNEQKLCDYAKSMLNIGYNIASALPEFTTELAKNQAEGLAHTLSTLLQRPHELITGPALLVYQAADALGWYSAAAIYHAVQPSLWKDAKREMRKSVYDAYQFAWHTIKNANAKDWAAGASFCLDFALPWASLKAVKGIAQLSGKILAIEKIAAILKRSKTFQDAKVGLALANANAETFFFSEVLNAFNRNAQLIHKSENLYHKIYNSDFYTNSASRIAKSGRSVAKFNRRIRQLCIALDDAQEIERVAQVIEELEFYQQKMIPRGFAKHIKVDFEHIFSIEFKRGGIKGFHYDFESMIEKCGKIEVLGKEQGPNGIYRGAVKYGNQIKDSTFFPPWSPKKLLEKIFEAVESHDLTQYSSEIPQKLIGITNEGFQIEITINLKSLEVITAYPYYPPWKNGDMRKKIYGRQ